MKMLKAMKLKHRQTKMEAYTTNFNIYQFEGKIVAKVHVKTKPKSVARYKKISSSKQRCNLQSAKFDNVWLNRTLKMSKRPQIHFTIYWIVRL